MVCTVSFLWRNHLHMNPQEIQKFIVDRIQQSHKQIATDLMSKLNYTKDEASERVHKTCQDFMVGRFSLIKEKEPELLKELIESTREARKAAMEDKDYATVISAAQLLAKLGGLLD